MASDKKMELTDLQREIIHGALIMKRASLLRLRAQQVPGSSLYGAFTADLQVLDSLIDSFKLGNY